MKPHVIFIQPPSQPAAHEVWKNLIQQIRSKGLPFYLLHEKKTPDAFVIPGGMEREIPYEDQPGLLHGIRTALSQL